MEDCLERLGCGAEIRQKIVNLRPIRRLENSVNPALNVYLFESRKNKATKEKDWLRLEFAVPKIH